MWKRTISLMLCGLLAMGAVGCGDDDGAECGDDVAEGNELCDGADLNGNICSDVGNFTGGTLACNNTCDGWDTSMCTSSANCGNNQIDTGELCDGVNLNGNDCTDVGNFTGGTLACNATCDGWNTSGCVNLPNCGNNQIDTGETCDGSDLGGNDCTDVGNFTGGTLACAASCDGWNTSGCTVGQDCGNGQIDTGEICDGHAVGSATCQSQNFSGGILICNATCSGYDTTGCFNHAGTCGNAIREFPEQCDGADLGTADCESWGFTGGTLACASTCALDFSGCTGDSCQENGNYGDGVCDPCEIMGGSADSDCSGCGSDGNCVSYIHTSLFMTTCLWTTGSEDPDCGYCGNGQMDVNQTSGGIVEWCDATDLGLFDCQDFGFAGGQIACTNDCHYDLSGCADAQCGNNLAEGTEACDGTDLRGLSCQAIGYSGGTLGCDGTCNLVTSGCTGTQLTCPTDDQYEDNDTIAAAAGVSPPVATNGIICTGDSDFFSFTATAGAIIVVDLIFVDAVGDLDLILYDPSETEVAYSLSTTDNERIEYTVPAGQGGTYYVEAYGYSSAEAPYALNITAAAPVCGNNQAEGNEACDGSDLRGLDCTAFGYTGGTLTCHTSCNNFVFTGCTGATGDVFVAGPGLGLAIPDGTYDGSLGTMGCVDIQVPSSGANTITSTSLRIGMTHTWIGDVVIKLISPSSTVLTVMSRPGLAETADDGTGCCGDSSNAAAAFPLFFIDGGATDAENMGANIDTDGVVCQDDSLCNYFPNHGAGPGTNFADFNGENAAGTWQVCVGDSVASDAGSVDMVVLTLTKQ